MTAEPVYIGHDDPVGRCERSGAVLVDLAPFGEPGFFEQLVVAPVEGLEVFEVRCVPLRAYGFSFGDEVGLGMTMMVERVVRRKGNRTLRVLLAPSAEHDGTAATFREEVDGRASALGLLFEWNGWGNVAINVTTEQIAPVIECIGGYVDRGLAFWEWSETVPFKPPTSPWPHVWPEAPPE
ncbi:DUF4265 domain-containing protein [Lentzea cavernae]|uniref:DUF4265 domain-containing protein n=1 Tax=Lentzea cavernae TaxID=2020703 RepID=A0ABQ3M619_9PSEU|nr:DUF4265 domain-containing protein [Lentzea cavernae]GHH33382.1 hypothetical protein GCM10017774_15730 [Lentzea cavernae]